jgi:hypothetical protein
MVRRPSDAAATSREDRRSPRLAHPSRNDVGGGDRVGHRYGCNKKSSDGGLPIQEKACRYSKLSRIRISFTRTVGHHETSVRRALSPVRKNAASAKGPT